MLVLFTSSVQPHLKWSSVGGFWKPHVESSGLNISIILIPIVQCEPFVNLICDPSLNTVNPMFIEFKEFVFLICTFKQFWVVRLCGLAVVTFCDNSKVWNWTSWPQFTKHNVAMRHHMWWCEATTQQRYYIENSNLSYAC